ncbi:MAG: transporter related protein [Solirubrobacterales bacterium]|jgi:branched-chain amino acid transport system ATP-binding protein|nr:transporter related protein [Solirubrobacterales bacterium]
MLKVENLEVRYGRLAAVRNVSFEVGKGEFVGLIGPNGAGKTSTLAAITGLVSPSAGSVTFDGESLLGRSPEQIVRRGVSLIPEGRQIFGTLTVAENLSLGSTARSDRSTLADDLERELERFPILRTYYDTPAGRLSGGEQQQLAIARALLGQPRMLLLDEPSLGLAPLMIDAVFEVLTHLRDEGVTIVLVEQNAARTIEVADRCYVLRSGEVALTGSSDEILATADVAAAYLGG